MRRRLRVLPLLAALLCALSACGGGAWQYRPITDVDDLQGRRVGVNLSWEADYILTGRSDLQLVRCDSAADMILALRFDKVDALAVDDTMWKVMSAGSEGLHRVLPAFASVGYIAYFGAAREDLMRDFNAFLAEHKKTDAYAEHLERLEDFDGWNYEGPDVPLTGTGETLRVAFLPEAYPRAFQEAGADVPVGFDMEILKYYANDRDLRPEFTASSYTDFIIGLSTGAYDMAIGYLGDVYEKEVHEAGLYTSDALDYMPLYFIEKTQRDIRVRTEDLG